MEKLKAAVIGGGMIANSAHLPAYRYFSDRYTVCAVCDVNGKAAEDTAAAFGIPAVYTDAAEMLEKEKPDVVSVCAPNMLHKQYAMLALSMGANVLCEKPMAFTRADAEEMFACADAHGVKLEACQSMRFTPDRLAAKRMIAAGELGTPYFCEFSRIRRRGIPTWGTFHIREKSGGGALIDIGVHMLDAALWLMGNPKVTSVSADAVKKLHTELGTLQSSGAFTGSVQNARRFDPDEMNVEDFASGSIRFADGARMNFKTAWAANLPDETSIRLIGEKAGIVLPEGKVYRGLSDDSVLDILPEPYPQGAPFSGHFHLLENFYSALVQGGTLAVQPEETVQVAAVIEAFYRSAELGKEVSVSE